MDLSLCLRQPKIKKHIPCPCQKKKKKVGSGGREEKERKENKPDKIYDIGSNGFQETRQQEANEMILFQLIALRDFLVKSQRNRNQETPRRC